MNGKNIVITICCLAAIIVVLVVNQKYEWRYGWRSESYEPVIDDLRGSDSTLVEIYGAFFSESESIAEKYRNSKSIGDLEIYVLTPERIQRGMEFLIEHNRLLTEIEAWSGVKKEVLVAILAVESDFGNYLGECSVMSIFESVINSDLIPEEKKARALEELISFLEVCRQNKWNPYLIKGYYAGEIGWSQFLPSSYLEYAVDWNGDGMKNLFDYEDALASIAFYLKSHGWQKNKTIAENKKAIYTYNNNDNYVDCVVKYAYCLEWHPYPLLPTKGDLPLDKKPGGT